MPSIWVRPIWIRLALAGVVLLGIAAVAVAHRASSQAYANGRTVEFERQVAGSYEIAFGKIPPTPIVGNFFVSILLTDTTSNAPLMGANVVMSATGPPLEDETSPTGDGPEIGPIVVQPDPNPEQYPGYYDSDTIVLERPGQWTFTVSVDTPESGEATAEFLVDVTTPNPITGIVTLVALLAFIVVVSLAVRMYIRERRRSRTT